MWNNGNTSPGLTDVAAGTYAVTVTDASFCSQSLTGISITQPDEISVSASAGTIACNGNTTSLTVTASGGNGTLLYSINGVDFQASNTFTVAASSSAYIVSVKDASNCIKTTNILVTQPETLTLSTAVNNCTCPGASNGSITLTVSGGTGPFNYDWADVSGTNNSKNRTALASGTYNVLVTDSHSCPANTSATVINTSSTPVQPALIIH